MWVRGRPLVTTPCDWCCCSDGATPPGPGAAASASDPRVKIADWPTALYCLSEEQMLERARTLAALGGAVGAAPWMKEVEGLVQQVKASGALQGWQRDTLIATCNW